MMNASVHQLKRSFACRIFFVFASTIVFSASVSNEVCSQTIFQSEKFGKPLSIREPRFRQAIEQAAQQAKQVTDA
jgi:hypothetical protein